jgi:endoglucanase
MKCSLFAVFFVITIAVSLCRAAEPKLYNVGSQALVWVNSHPDDPRAKLIREKIASQPQAQWLAGHVPSGLKGEADIARSRGEILLKVTYNIPGRDNGNYSAGGLDGPAAYDEWIRTIAGFIDGTEAWFVVEPDAIGLAPNLKDPVKRDERYGMISNSVSILQQNKNTRAYLAVSGWHGIDGAAEGFKKAGGEKAYGFAYNISGYHSLEECYDFCEKLSAKLGGKHYIIDTSRGGNGQWKPADPNEKEAWCNPPGRALGQPPTFVSDHPKCDGLFWIKRPGESDGTCRGGPKAGQFSPEIAYELAKNAKW